MFLRGASGKDQQTFKKYNKNRYVLYYGKTNPPNDRLGFHLSLAPKIKSSYYIFKKFKDLFETQKISLQIRRIAHYNRFIAAEVSLKFHHKTSQKHREEIKTMFYRLATDSPHISLFNLTNFALPRRALQNTHSIYRLAAVTLFGVQTGDAGQESILNALSLKRLDQPLTIEKRKLLYTLIENWFRTYIADIELLKLPKKVRIHYKKNATLNKATLSHLEALGWQKKYRQKPLKAIKDIVESGKDRPLAAIKLELMGVSNRAKDTGPLGGAILLLHKSPDMDRLLERLNTTPFMSFVTEKSLRESVENLNKHIQSLPPEKLILSPTSNPSNKEKKEIMGRLHIQSLPPEKLGFSPEGYLPGQEKKEIVGRFKTRKALYTCL